MKFSTQFAVFALALGVAASDPPTIVKKDPPTLVGRDLATVTSVIAAVDAGIKSLDSAVQAFSGDPAKLNSAAQSLISTINSGTTTVQGTANLSLTDALALQTPVQALQGDAQSLVNDLTAKKTAFEAAGLCSTIETTANNLNTASQALIAAVVSKVPAEAQTIAQQLASGVTTTLQEGVAAFSSGNCTNTGGSSSSAGGGSSSAASSSTAGSSSAAPTSSAGSGGASSTATQPTTTSSSNSTTTSPTTVVTAAAAGLRAIGAEVGLVAALFAALML